jgi:hypothetical protein
VTFAIIRGSSRRMSSPAFPSSSRVSPCLLVTTFGRYNLAYLDRTPLERFPQDQIAVVLCLLDVPVRAQPCPMF